MSNGVSERPAEALQASTASHYSTLSTVVPIDTPEHTMLCLTTRCLAGGPPSTRRLSTAASMSASGTCGKGETAC